MDYNDVDELKKEFKDAKHFDFPEEMTVAGLPYKLTGHSSYDMLEMLKNGIKAVISYGTFKRQEANDKGLAQFIVFLWGFRDNIMVPYDVRTLSAARMGLPITEGMDKINVDRQKVLGTTTEIIIANIPGCPPIKAKVDTGADISSIHASDWSTNNGQVTFQSDDISPNRITLPVIEKQAIKSSNGDIEYRPVVELDVKVNGVPMSGVMFNLNDRGTMEYSILIGKNVLERGGFLIDPKLDEEIDYDNIDLDAFEINWESLAEDFKDDIVEVNSNITEEDVIQYIKNNK